MSSAKRGARTFTVEVTNLSRHGSWILVGERELFLPFDGFPWFADATVAEILDVALPGPGHLHWPKLDVDLAIESIDHPELYPLTSSMPAKRRASPRRGASKAGGRGRGKPSPR